MDELLTMPEAARRLGISPAAVRRLVRAGRLDCVRPTLGGRSVRVPAASVARHVERSTTRGEMDVDPATLKWVTL